VRSKVNVFVELFRQRKELQEAQAQLQRAVGMRDDFMSMIAHELRNPLNSVYLQAQLRRKMLAAPKPPDSQTMLKMVERDERQIRSMVRLLDDMLDVSRARTGKLAIVPGAFDLAASVTAVVDAIQDLAHNQGVTVTLGRARHPALRGRRVPHRAGDHQPADQCAALRAGQAGGGDRGHPRAGARGLRFRCGTRAWASRRKDQERIFEQFERTEGAAQVAGLGLGLYIARQIAQAHQGGWRCAARPAKARNSSCRCPWRAPQVRHEKMTGSFKGIARTTSWTQNAST
jgi:signal transduction histidine kinase